MAHASTMVYTSGESMRSILAVLPVSPGECVRIHTGMFTDVSREVAQQKGLEYLRRRKNYAQLSL
jgi:hypothetical protein